MEPAEEAGVERLLQYWENNINTGAAGARSEMEALATSIRDLLQTIKNTLGQAGSLAHRHNTLQSCMQQLMGRVEQVSQQANNSHSNNSNKGVLDCRGAPAGQVPIQKLGGSSH